MNGLDFGTAIGLIKGLGSPDPAVIESAVSDWLDDHPEATTTVQDGSITKAKLDSNLQGTVDDVADLKSQMSAKASTDMALGAYPTDTVAGAVASFSDGGDNLPVKDLTIAIEPVQAAGTPTPEAPLPISGWTGANLFTAGANLVPCADKDYSGSSNTIRLMCENGVFTLSNRLNYGIGITSLISQQMGTVQTVFGNRKQLQPGTYSFSVEITGLVGPTEINNIALYLIDEVTGTQTTIPNGQTRTISKALDISEIHCTLNGGFSVGASISFKVQLEAHDSITEWEPFKGTTIPITFPTEAGTVYGGTLDVTTGVLTVDMVEVDLGDWTWTKGNRNNSDTGYTYNHRENNYISGCLLSSNRKVYVDTKVWGTLEPNEILMASGYFVVVVDVATATEAKAALAGSKIVYGISQPQTYQLTPVEVLTLLGANTIYADTGDTTVTYRADPTLYANKRSNATRSIIAGIEPTMTASKAYTTGQLLIVGDTLYKVAASIASGATLTPGTNVNPTTVAEQLLLLANA